MSSTTYFFIGGPWNNRLMNIGGDPRFRFYFRIPEPMDMIIPDIDDLDVITPPKWKEIVYRLDDPLPTGCMVISCLNLSPTGRPRVFHPGLRR